MHEHTGQQARRLERQYSGSGTLTRSPHVAPRRHGLRRLAGAAVSAQVSTTFQNTISHEIMLVESQRFREPCCCNKVNTVRRHVLHCTGLRGPLNQDESRTCFAPF
jgi:hypothetical protein